MDGWMSDNLRNSLSINYVLEFPVGKTMKNDNQNFFLKMNYMKDSSKSIKIWFEECYFFF